MTKLSDYFNDDQYTIFVEKDWKSIRGWLEAKNKTVVTYGQQELEETGYYLLAQSSPAHKGDKPAVFVCKMEDYYPSRMIERDRGYDAESINRHSWRTYSFIGDSDNSPNLVISRCTDVKYFEAYDIDKHGKIIYRFPSFSAEINQMGWKNALRAIAEIVMCD